MNEANAYDEQFSINELGRSGNKVVNVVRDSRTPNEPVNTHWDVTEVDDNGAYETFHINDPAQTYLGNDF